MATACSAPTSSTTAATSRWGAPGTTSTSRRWAGRKSGKTRPRAILRPRPTSGGTGTTATSQTQRPTRSGSRYRTPERRRSGTNTRARSHEAGLFRWDLTGGDGRAEGAAIGRSAKVRCEEWRECPELTDVPKGTPVEIWFQDEARILPSRAPELNPVENIWQYTRANWLSNRVFETYDAIIDAACEAWRKLVAQPKTITSIGRRDWAHVGQSQ